MTPALKAALRKSEEFHGLKPRRLRKISIEWQKAMVQIGDCLRVDYVSDKFDGKPRHYFHEFEGRAKLFAFPITQSDGESVLIIKGKFKILADGIVG